jgi:hypothetical protein
MDAIDMIKDGERVIFSEGLHGKRFQYDHLPIVYSTGDLTYDRVFNGDSTPKYTVPPWSVSDGLDMVRDLKSLQRQVVVDKEQ